MTRIALEEDTERKDEGKGQERPRRRTKMGSTGIWRKEKGIEKDGKEGEEKESVADPDGEQNLITSPTFCSDRDNFLQVCPQLIKSS